jgi:hypothetical protein
MSDRIPEIFGPWKGLRTEKKVKVRPNQAKLVLEFCNLENRPVPHGTVAMVNYKLTNGLWRYNGEPAVFADDGRLIDGQGRFTGCAQANVPMLIDICLGHDWDDFDTYDRGKKRNEADDLAIVGEKNSKALSAALKIICAYFGGVRSSHIQNAAYTYQDLKPILEEYPIIRDSVHFSTMHREKILCAQRLVAAVHFLAGVGASSKVIARRDEFFDRLVDGINLSKGDPVLALRDKLIMMDRDPNTRVKKGMGSLTTMTQLHSLVRAWNSYLSGSKITKIQLTYNDPAKATLSDLPDIKTGYRMTINREDTIEPDSKGATARL